MSFKLAYDYKRTKVEAFLRKLLSRYQLSTMFSIVIFMIALAVSSVVQTMKYNESKATLENNLKSKAESILDFADVLLESRNEKFFSGQSDEIPQVIQNEIFDKFTEISEGKVFFKEASKTPTNPKNLARDYEGEAIDFFTSHKEAKQREQKIIKDSTEYYMMSRPIVAEEKCMMCHPTWTQEGEVVAIENVLIDLSDYYAALKESVISSTLFWLLNIGILLLVIHVLFKKLVSNRINKVLEIIFRVEKGNFVIDDMIGDENMSHGTSRNEIDRIFRHLLDMVNSLKPIIDNVVSQSKDVVFESIYGYTKIQENLKLSHHQTEVLEHSKKNIHNILDINTNVEHSLGDVIEKSDEAVVTIQNGRDIVQHNLLSSQKASDAMHHTVESIEGLRHQSEEISKAVSYITDIANETNLIALNAAIEAARAGEHGRGFAVVADKIRELADVSLDNVDTINGVLKSIHSNIDHVTKNASNTGKIIQELNESSNLLNDNFNNINQAINVNNRVLGALKENFQMEKSALQEVNSDLVDVEKSSDNLNHNALELSGSVNAITNVSGVLKNLTDGFDVIYNKRTSSRQVVVPPVETEFKLNSGKTLSGYLYDTSEHGLSFIITETFSDMSVHVGDRGIISMKREIEGAYKHTIEIVHITQKKENGTRQFGAIILD